MQTTQSCTTAVEAEHQWMQTLHSTESRELTEAYSVSWGAYHAAQ